MNAAVFVTFARVAPVEHEHAAVGTVTDFHAAEPRISRNQKVHPVPAHVAAAVAFEDFLIGTAAMEIQREKPSAILRGPVVALVNHHPDVSVAAAQIVRHAVP